jgi:hypothetical protein
MMKTEFLLARYQDDSGTPQTRRWNTQTSSGWWSITDKIGVPVYNRDILKYCIHCLVFPYSFVSYFISLRLVPFVLIIAVLEEVILLITIFSPNVPPFDLHSPSQRLKIDAKKTERGCLRINEGILVEMRIDGLESGPVDIHGQLAISGRCECFTNILQYLV